MTYLDELSDREDPTLESTREEMKTKCQTWVEYCDLRASLSDAFELWDSVRRVPTVVNLNRAYRFNIRSSER
jgi:hypothetical protein